MGSEMCIRDSSSPAPMLASSGSAAPAAESDKADAVLVFKSRRDGASECGQCGTAAHEGEEGLGVPRKTDLEKGFGALQEGGVASRAAEAGRRPPGP